MNQDQDSLTGRSRAALTRARVGVGWADASTLLAWILPLFAWAPLTYPGYFECQSGFLQVFNLNDLLAHWGDLGWVPSIGQSYDLLRGEGVLPYLVAALPRLLGTPLADAIELAFGLSLLAGAAGMHAWVRRWLGGWPALVSTAIYVYWPIGLVTTYTRGALAEAVLLGVMPWVLWAADRRTSPTSAVSLPGSPRNSLRSFAVFRVAAGVISKVRSPLTLALALALALWSQVGLALWLTVLVLVYGVLASMPVGVMRRVRRSKSQPASAKATEVDFKGRGGRDACVFLTGWLGGVSLGVLGLLPTVLHHGWNGITYVNFVDHFVSPDQLLLAGWSTGPGIPGPDDTLPFSLGVMAFGLATLGLCLPRKDAKVSDLAAGAGAAHGTDIPYRGPVDLNRSRTRGSDATMDAGVLMPSFGLAVTLLIAYLVSTLAAPIWRQMPFLTHTLTYPWQLLLLTGPWLAWLAGLGSRRLLALLSDHTRERRGVLLISALIVLILLEVYGGLQPRVVSMPVPAAPVAILGENEIALLSVVTTGTPAPGGQVAISAQWQALRPLDQDLTVFFHVIGPDGTRYGQQDTVPHDGQSPTSRWRPGQIVSDQYQLTLSVDAPVGGDYRYWLGFYALETGQRLAVGDDDKVVLVP